MQYTAGELAKALNVSARTVRFYDEKGILKPINHSDSGYRLYDESSVEKLEQILLLRFLDFSIEQIREMGDISQSLKEQERLIRDRKEHLERLLTAVVKAQAAGQEELWESLRHIVEVMRDREYVIEQYNTTENLDKRISIHDYSTAEIGFYPWMMQHLNLKAGMKILDIGCGTGAFWEAVAGALPKDLELHLVDYSEDMLDKIGKAMQRIQEQYPEKHLQFHIQRQDATDFQYPETDFDRIMANHMLYHLKKEHRLSLYEQIMKRLKSDGLFTCSLIGKTHFQELHNFVHHYYPQIYIMSRDFDIWLETAVEELKPFFPSAEMLEQDNDLLVPDKELLYNYVSSYSALAAEVVKKDRPRFMQRIQKYMNQNGCMYIHKSTGMIICFR